MERLELDIQRCVDGELAEMEEVSLLRQLDHLPGGWRRLALALLEDRLFRQAVQHSLTVRESVRPAVRPAEDFQWGTRRFWKSTAAVGMSLCLGMALGLAWLQWIAVDPGEPLPQERISQSAPAAVDQQLATTATLPTQLVSQQPAPQPDAADKLISRPLPGPRAPVHSAVVGATVLPVGLGNAARQVAEVELPPLAPGDQALRVPVYDSRDIPARFLEESTPVIPPEIQEHLRQQGIAVDQERQFLLIELDDGRRILLPRDAVRIRYAAQ